MHRALHFSRGSDRYCTRSCVARAAAAAAARRPRGSRRELEAGQGSPAHGFAIQWRPYSRCSYFCSYQRRSPRHLFRRYTLASGPTQPGGASTEWEASAGVAQPRVRGRPTTAPPPPSPRRPALVLPCAAAAAAAAPSASRYTLTGVHARRVALLLPPSARSVLARIQGTVPLPDSGLAVQARLWSLP
jgi:hypothetical protein